MTGEPFGTSASSAPLLLVENLVATFPMRTGPLRRTAGHIRAVGDLSFHVDAAETVALVGESGSGKSTAARTIIGLHAADSGRVSLNGVAVDPRSRSRPTGFRSSIQLIFQDPFSSLNPRMRVADQVVEPLVIAGRAPRSERAGMARDLLRAVGLPADAGRRYPHQFSGGQRQRIAIARALAVRPRLVICDEPVSALDVSVQAQVLELLRGLQAESGVAYLFISHDLAVVRSTAQRVLVMYLGRVMESARTETLFARPRHPYTQALVSAARVPVPSIERRRRRIVLTGEIPSAADPPSGCAFRTRCMYAIERCAAEVPGLRRVDDSTVACHRADDIPPWTTRL